MARVGIVEDDLEFLNEIKCALSSYDHEVHMFSTYEEFATKRKNNDCDIFLVDWNINGEQKGLDILKDIRDEDNEVPIFMISANDLVQDVVKALKLGANDYIRKPLHFEELMAKMDKVLFKKSSKNKGIKLLPEVSGLEFQGNLIALTNKEFLLFEYLYNKMGQVISRDEFLKKFEDIKLTTKRNIDVHIFSLRKKISQTDVIIRSVRARGYCLEKL